MSIESHCVFTEAESITLLGSKSFPFISKHEIFTDIAAACEQELHRLLSRDDVLTTPAMGRQSSKWENSKYR
jgi:hypothetical protein